MRAFRIDGRERHSRGFTLVEVMLALGLMVVILGALYGALGVYARLTTAGQAEVERAQIARSVLRQIERDLRCVTYRKPQMTTAVDPLTGQAAGTTSAMGTTDPTMSGTTGTAGMMAADPLAAQAIDPAMAYAGSNVGLFGDASTLIVHISRPSREAEYAALGDLTGGRTSDLLSVSWFLAVANGQGLQGAVGNLASGGSARVSRASGVQGLARLEGDRLALNLADAEGDITEMAAGAQLVAEEITALQFRYFDGAVWQPMWDSTALGGLPLAVEVVVGFSDDDAPANATTAAEERQGIAPVSETYRLVVALPLAEPYIPTVGY